MVEGNISVEAVPVKSVEADIKTCATQAATTAAGTAAPLKQIVFHRVSHIMTFLVELDLILGDECIHQR